MSRSISELDSALFDKKLGIIKKQTPDWMLEMTTVAGIEASKILISLAERHRDTNRFISSIETATNDIAVAGNADDRVSPRAIQRSKRADQIEEALEISILRAQRQEQRILRWIRGNENKENFNPKWPSHRKLLRDLDKAGDITDAAIQRLEEFRSLTYEEQGQVILIYGTKSQRKRKTNVKLTGRNLARVSSHKVYGGEGRIVWVNGTAVATIVSKEPHARIIERRFRFIPNTFELLRIKQSASKRISASFVKNLEESTEGVSQ